MPTDGEVNFFLVVVVGPPPFSFFFQQIVWAVVAVAFWRLLAFQLQAGCGDFRKQHSKKQVLICKRVQRPDCLMNQ
jgi:ABC-type long-subunit fatty acid transport system fused permease/ATPase subunit